jgi:glutamine amidotransferase
LRKVVIIDYGLCNLDSVARAIEECGGVPLITNRPEDLRAGDRVIIPGVGAFGKAMENLRSAGMDDAIREHRARRQMPILGICLGMQLLADSSEEGGQHAGLGLIHGKVARFQRQSPNERIPHVGWNDIEIVSPHPLLKDMTSGTNFYFVHSYHFSCADPRHTVARTPYCGGFASVVADGDVMGVQFHPEKSQKAGFALLRNFLAV